ncbi:hypothetical protein PR048_001288 [Dryococelus australis]|uniref:Uncharacterized protein n=1 Tax=Dryococelus australis TaxID=614101 RepID=A0ABQ9IH17_9NEOP|nr:hypothetical protein PR048_001288 [Dryococelus australis]
MQENRFRTNEARSGRSKTVADEADIGISQRSVLCNLHAIKKAPILDEDAAASDRERSCSQERVLNENRDFHFFIQEDGAPPHYGIRSLPDFRMWESCRTMPLVGGFSRGSPVSSTLSFRRCSILTSITLIGSQDLTVKSRPNLFTHSRGRGGVAVRLPASYQCKAGSSPGRIIRIFTCGKRIGRGRWPTAFLGVTPVCPVLITLSFSTSSSFQPHRGGRYLKDISNIKSVHPPASEMGHEGTLENLPPVLASAGQLLESQYTHVQAYTSENTYNHSRISVLILTVKCGFCIQQSSTPDIKRTSRLHRGSVGLYVAGLGCGRFWVRIPALRKPTGIHLRFAHAKIQVDKGLNPCQGEPGSILGWITQGFSQVPDDASGRRVFLRISRFPQPSRSGAAPFSLRLPSSALKTSLLRAVTTPVVKIGSPWWEVSSLTTSHSEEARRHDADLVTCKECEQRRYNDIGKEPG